MFSEEPNMTRLMKGMVRRLTADPGLREDLYQEARVRLWEAEARRPGQTASWYLQNCQFHLQNLLKHGRSVDSPKRRSQLRWQEPYRPSPDDSEFCWNGPMETGSERVDNDLMSNIYARDAMAALQDDLTLRQKRILAGLIAGATVREVARSIGVSHVAVLKQRQRIASIASRLGIGGEQTIPPPSVRTR